VCCSVKRDAMSADNPLSSTPQAKVVCRMSTVDRMCILVHHIHTVDLLPSTSVLCPASVSDLYIARSLPGQRVHVMSVSERLC